ncbi:2-amino-4-hydroxy-6-hydroxymethyldihydropteridine diphosphokinase [Entomomonas sp. E2T0]|uniref:2-amino-4-hydroxy-6- hydroxymethyldihydropteridine diphosphokinase n=1 Tax=Entomomonas sp. E2T0 TaxID=2930213 RepID=UPI0022283DD3|nr:2-amino-4-hydroxy-6-hydroxymethyldihydropteridine diphosphokinase [Entomomonas sp. E2T0]UYZ83906.1 2-amino-4-hydroxy-6-hydroxymethyldihydropteridine diphosphokinase [Entomomonas sp. E2T0]
MSLTQVWLGLGSNIDQQQHISAALLALSNALQDMQCSPVFESESVGITSSNFYNLVVTGSTSLPLFELSAILKKIEADNGRYDKNKKSLPLDVDLLLYGEQVGEFDHITLPHTGILKNAYVLLPLSLLSPFHKHPVLGMTFSEIWRHSQSEINQKLWMIDTPWLCF